MAVSPILEFSALYEARESVDVDGQALCLLRCQGHQRKYGLRAVLFLPQIRVCTIAQKS